MNPLWFNMLCIEENKITNSLKDNKLVIFLDTLIWIKLRESHEKKDIYYDLYNVMKRSVEQQKCLFPLIENVYFELLKRKNTEDLFLTAKIIDELSYATMQINLAHLSDFETWFFINKTSPQLYLNRIQTQYQVIPVRTDDNETEIEKNKEFIKSFMRTPLEVLFRKQIPDASFYESEYIRNIYRDLANSITSKEKDKYKSFASLLSFELEASLDALYHLTKVKNKLPETFVEEAMNCKDLHKYMPFCVNTAALYASVRWSELNNLKTNDIYDIINFPCAIGYCDYFFSEQKYINRYKQKPLSNYLLEGTKFEFDPNKMIEIIEKST